MVALLWPSVCIAPNANIAAMATNGPRGWPRKSSTKLDMMQGIKRMAANYRSATRTGRFSGMGLDLRSHAQYNAMTSESQALTSTTNQKSPPNVRRLPVRGGASSISDQPQEPQLTRCALLALEVWGSLRSILNEDKGRWSSLRRPVCTRRSRDSYPSSASAPPRPNCQR
ncbi:hypothetical protein GQ602_003895 [Ophiocordyceps camponoti-floridani]|uniref:Uncharacterized protein n=1 Tax=Ophiocordyceps camponoti-floridani TaxID=2030778 RepID=A0A8H4Q5S9_9HYPO|nr:hypothetical protein GQ602_003895 [Ophiocordyceps camponoti-floridani]